MADQLTDTTKDVIEQTASHAVLGTVMQMNCVAQNMQMVVQEILFAYSAKMCQLIAECDTIDEVHEVLGMEQIQGVMTEFNAQ